MIDVGIGDRRVLWLSRRSGAIEIGIVSWPPFTPEGRISTPVSCFEKCTCDSSCTCSATSAASAAVSLPFRCFLPTLRRGLFRGRGLRSPACHPNIPVFLTRLRSSRHSRGQIFTWLTCGGSRLPNNSITKMENSMEDSCARSDDPSHLEDHRR